MTIAATPNLSRAREVIDLVGNVVDIGVRHLTATGDLTFIVLAYDLAHSAAAVAMARSPLDHEQRIHRGPPD